MTRMVPEFCNMMSQKMSYAEDEEMVKLAFRTLDKDGSGSISTTEFKHLMTHIGTQSVSGGNLLCVISCMGDSRHRNGRTD